MCWPGVWSQSRSRFFSYDGVGVENILWTPQPCLARTNTHPPHTHYATTAAAAAAAAATTTTLPSQQNSDPLHTTIALLALPPAPSPSPGCRVPWRARPLARPPLDWGTAATRLWQPTLAAPEIVARMLEALTSSSHYNDMECLRVIIMIWNVFRVIIMIWNIFESL